MMQKMVDGVLVDMTDAEIDELAADRAAQSVVRSRQAVLSELATLDIFIPRGLEDMWTASSFDASSLPQIQQDRLARKIALRAELSQPT